MKNFAWSVEKALRLMVSAVMCLAVWDSYAQTAKPQPASLTISKTTLNGTNSSAPAILPSASKAIVAHPTEIKTIDGKTYSGVTVQRVEPDGIVAEYRPAGGGTGITKIKFKDMPANLQQQYKYDPAKASAYEVGRARGIAAWQAEQKKNAETAKAAAAQRAREDALEKQEQAA